MSSVWNRGYGSSLLRARSHAATRIRSLHLAVVLGSAALSAAGCGAQKSPDLTDLTRLQTPSRQILVTEGDLNKPYDILGEVECVLGSQSLYSDVTAPGGDKEALDVLRRVAFTEFGEDVDAIINSKVSVGIEGGFAGQLAGAYGARTAVVTAKGIAIKFK